MSERRKVAPRVIGGGGGHGKIARRAIGCVRSSSEILIFMTRAVVRRTSQRKADVRRNSSDPEGREKT